MDVARILKDDDNKKENISFSIAEVLYYEIGWNNQKNVRVIFEPGEHQSISQTSKKYHISFFVNYF